MFPITEDKFLLKFLGKTLLEHQIEQAREAGLSDFVIVGNPANIEEIGQITESLTDVDVRLAVQREPLGIANALESAKDMLDGKPIVVVNPNDVFDGSAYAEITRECRRGTVASYILAYQVNSYFPGGYLVVNEQNELKHIVEKPRRGEEPSNLVNILVHLHTQPGKLLDHIKAVSTASDDVYERALDRMAQDGYGIKAVEYQGFWAVLKYPWQIFTLVDHFLNRVKRSIPPSAEISEKAIIEGNVLIEDGVKVLENAVIRGPCYIGRNSIIGNSVLIRDHCHIGQNCAVGYGTEVKHSYIGDDCWFHSSYIGDSIIGDGCSFGAGTIIANLRFDERNIVTRIGEERVDTGLDKLGAIIGSNCRTGVNVSIMPGVRVGPNSIISSHTCLTQELGANKMIQAEHTYKVVENEVKPAERRIGELRHRLGG